MPKIFIYKNIKNKYNNEKINDVLLIIVIIKLLKLFVKIKRK